MQKWLQRLAKNLSEKVYGLKIRFATIENLPKVTQKIGASREFFEPLLVCNTLNILGKFYLQVFVREFLLISTIEHFLELIEAFLFELLNLLLHVLFLYLNNVIYELLSETNSSK